ncbi:MAG: DUF2752 domain-containing protein [Chitinophagaceae bacterium]|nr:DUF2752 domain-containing protein [Chitinophagaceae bacterium]
MRMYSPYLLLVLALVTGVGLLFFFNPETSFYPPCLFKKFTGLQCPGCGSARACYHLLHGNFLTAIDYNLLLTVFLPLIVMEGFSRLFFINRGTESKLRIIQNHVRPLHVLVLVLIFWILRNVPIYPFSILSSDH